MKSGFHQENGGKFMLDDFIFRGQKTSNEYKWLNTDTLVFDFGDGEFTDSEENDYFLHFEYHVADNKWIIEIWWEDDNIDILELDECDADEYITREEIKRVKSFLELHFMK